MQLLQEARDKMGLQKPATPDNEQAPADEAQPPGAFRQAAARCWALLLVRIYECFPLLCPNCFAPLRIVAFIEEPAVVESILWHIREPTQAPATRGMARHGSDGRHDRRDLELNHHTISEVRRRYLNLRWKISCVCLAVRVSA